MKTVWGQPHKGSNPFFSARFKTSKRLTGRLDVLNCIVLFLSVGATDILLRKTEQNDAGRCLCLGLILGVSCGFTTPYGAFRCFKWHRFVLVGRSDRHFASQNRTKRRGLLLVLGVDFGRRLRVYYALRGVFVMKWHLHLRLECAALPLPPQTLAFFISRSERPRFRFAKP